MTLPTHLIPEFDVQKNVGVSASELSPGSNKNVWWLCEKRHSYQASPVQRKSGRACPYCSGRKIWVGFNDLSTTHPELAAEWHPVKNTSLLVSSTSKGMTTKVWWLGKCGHEWEATINSRALKGNGCPYCSGRKPTPTTNLLAIYPHLAMQWHPTLNTLLLADVSAGSNRKVWWLGDCGHEWETTVSSRVKGSGCPYCSGYIPTAGVNDLATTHPGLAAQWDKKNSLSSSDVSAGSTYKAWWLCPQGHNWNTWVYARTAGNQCPHCWAVSYVSSAETEIYAFLVQLGFEVQQSNRTLLGNKQEIDLFVPEKMFGIEFNGLYWHSEATGKSSGYHQKKYEAAKAAGIQLIQIWEDDWVQRKDVVLQSLRHKLLQTTSRTYARTLIIRDTPLLEAQSFLTANHIQGFASGTHYVGLYDTSDVLHALLVLQQEKAGQILNIVRYATATHVIGGFTKLLKHAEKIYSPKVFVTFADHMVSDGGLYENNGFIADKVLPPDYMYVVGGERKHKFNYRLKRFQNDPNLFWEAGRTERELAALNGLYRVWDAGKTRYKKAI